MRHTITVCGVEGNILSIVYYSAQGIRVFQEPNSPRLRDVEISPFGPTNFSSSQWKFYFNFLLMKMRARDTAADGGVLISPVTRLQRASDLNNRAIKRARLTRELSFGD